MPPSRAYAGRIPVQCAAVRRVRVHRGFKFSVMAGGYQPIFTTRETLGVPCALIANSM